MDVDAYNDELEAEEKDSANIIAVRQRASEFFQALELDE